MEKEFIPYMEALELKELGFDEPCFAWYGSEDIFEISGNYKNSTHTIGYCVSSPLYQQAFSWFRQKYKLHQYINQYYGQNFYFHIDDMVHPRRVNEYTVEMLRTFNESTSYEEAESECLKKLIEIVKTKQS